MNAALLFVRSGQRFADRPAVALGGDVLLSQGALIRRAAAMAGALHARFGLRPGDRAALVMRNVPEYIELLLAGWHAGLTMVPVNAKLHRREIAYILEHAGARVAFVQDAARSIDARRGAELLADWVRRGVSAVTTSDVLAGRYER